MKTLHNRCAGLDVHKAEVVACLRVANRGRASYELRRAGKRRSVKKGAPWLKPVLVQCAHAAAKKKNSYFLGAVPAPQGPAWSKESRDRRRGIDPEDRLS